MIKDEGFQTVEIKRVVEGHTDSETGEWIEDENTLIATAVADIQPKTGQQRANELQTEYESDYIAYIGIKDIEIPQSSLSLVGLAEYDDSVSLEQRLRDKGEYVFNQGDIFIDEYNRKYTLVFPGFWAYHYEMELKKIG